MIDISPSLTMLARAKVNLYLHVAAPDARNYHPLQSLVMFADVGDEVVLRPKNVGEGPRLTCYGPFADGVPTDGGNLILKALRRFEMVSGVNIDRHDVHLTKNLPIASGLGGGSADAGAVLQLLRIHYAPDMAGETLEAIAATTGADGAMCLWAQPALAEGYGERLTNLSLPAVPAVLINPGITCSTPEVYGQYDRLGQFAPIEASAPFRSGINIDNLIHALSETRNDLEMAAIHLHPQIGDLLTSLGDEPEARLARLSGSGATCFALCDTLKDAQNLAQRLSVKYPQSWVRACTLS
ncbi:4-(cytidine 5'-diphospho)-2-C-methyl-D-erythritol kinase [Asticcacaulis machinosus]|uniref:4-diphosphocytidyl-2-C-methyl-D-erythritol kinase n=1 Tax=Asticcacaulis machinosus TaxID=2984211 RepID=A0ABT5HFX5_9CAUL|nr:4-(cytidine 5'-diphospho)-2-C-methyl-D-erythritol kinase [Asticcacaulis machinosus]MDC7674981.1 4-(cytidine 5'-diphospho)-2-C-methyl-D-erythritol kinase [Asticcacaulis machinosus]